MAWNQIETNLFFRDSTQMGLSIPVQTTLHLEGIIGVDYLLEFDEDQRKTVVSNLSNPEIPMSAVRPKAPPFPIQGISYSIGEISLSQLKFSSEAGFYYD